MELVKINIFKTALRTTKNNQTGTLCGGNSATTGERFRWLVPLTFRERYNHEGTFPKR